MNLEECKSAGLVDSEDALVSIRGLVDEEGVAVIPAGVTSIRKLAIDDATVKTLFIPQSVETIEGELAVFIAFDGLAIGVYEGDDAHGAVASEYIFDLRGIRHFGQLPVFSPPAIHRDRTCVISSRATFDNFIGGHDRYEVVEDGGDLSSQDGILFANNGRTLLSYPRSSIDKGDLVIPDFVDRIGKRAFVGIRGTTLRIPPTVKTVEAEAFYLASIDSIVVEGADTEFCVDESLGLRNSTYRTIHHSPFSGSSSKEVVFSEGLPEISDHLFEETGVESFAIPLSVTRIGRKAFSCSAFLHLFMPDTVEYVASGAFDNVASVSLPKRFREDAERIFGGSGCTVVAVRGDADGSFCDAFFSPRALSDETDYVIREIREKRSVTFLDKCFHDKTVKTFANRIRIAITRLIASDKPSKAMRAEYAAYVKRNVKKAFKLFLDENDFVCIAMLEFLGYSLPEDIKESAIRATAVKKERAEKSDAAE